ncbi:hypothetical protein E5335_02385 [Coriobacteriaceae bacterium]|nr:hypothetical protein E5335_02385 [Coriobacteriaceae bacterium]
MTFETALSIDSDPWVPWDRILSGPGARCDLAGFSCGVDSMDEFLRRSLGIWTEKGFCAPYYAVAGDAVVGVYTLSPATLTKDVAKASLSNKHLGGKKSNEQPGVRIGRLAVGTAYSSARRGVGTALLIHAVRSAVDLMGFVGGRFVMVEPLDGMAEWYERNRFISPKGSRTWFLPIKTAREMIREMDPGWFVY